MLDHATLLNTADFQKLEPFLISLGVGILVGIERERNPTSRAGLRTCALVALLGAVTANLAEMLAAPWLIAIGLFVSGLMMIVANSRQPDPGGDPGTTTVIAVMLVYGLGVLVWLDQVSLAVTLGILMTLLLYFKAQLHGITRSLTAQDLISALQFAVLALVILPLLPDAGFGPYGAINPRQIWWMVVLISGVSLAGYAALRIFGQSHGAPLLGLLGGLVSSTATTLVYARHARQSESVTPLASVVILTANLVVLLRLAVLTAVVAPGVVSSLLPAVAGGTVAGLVSVFVGFRRLQEKQNLPELAVGNPTELKSALGFGLAYGIVLFLSAWLSDTAGSSGIYGVALVSGLTDVDAITLSSLHLFALDRLSLGQVTTSIIIAFMANMVFKSGVVISVGGSRLARQSLGGLLAIALGAAAGVFAGQLL